jgi:hypothetical protein
MHEKNKWLHLRDLHILDRNTDNPRVKIICEAENTKLFVVSTRSKDRCEKERSPFVVFRIGRI